MFPNPAAALVEILKEKTEMRKLKQTLIFMIGAAGSPVLCEMDTEQNRQVVGTAHFSHLFRSREILFDDIFHSVFVDLRSSIS